jgi:alkanesulfonate monooxygenase SsuD/methylene tetrahydromethanopterin reductase-like flavin-dependent oxidoreductase (luciferase family)
VRERSPIEGDAMRFGLFGSAQAPRGVDDSARGYRDFVEWNVEAEALGYHSSFLVEHHFTGVGQVSASLTLLTWVAARTRTLRLGTAVLVLPWHNPVLLAEQAATLDLLSGGRLDFGVGRGYRRNEFDGFCMAIEEADARFEEALDVIVKAWTSDAPFSHQGPYWRFHDIVVEPPPAQAPHPPIWIAAGSPVSIRRVAQRGAGLLLDQFALPADIGESIALYRAERAACGHTATPPPIAVARDVHVATDQVDLAQAREQQARRHRRMIELSRFPDDRHRSHILSYVDRPGGTQGSGLLGTPDQVARGLETLRAHGVDYVLINFGGTQRETLRRFARHVMPGFA